MFLDFIVSLYSSLEHTIRYGTTFFGSGGTNSNSIKLDGVGNECLDLTFTNQTNSGAACSICYAPRDVPVLVVSIAST
jgi:hypothetical protein